MDKIKAKLTRRISHKDKEPDFEAESGDEETGVELDREAAEAEKSNEYGGAKGSLLNRMISYGNKKTEDQIAAESAATQRASATTTGTGAPTSRME